MRTWWYPLRVGFLTIFVAAVLVSSSVVAGPLQNQTDLESVAGENGWPGLLPAIETDCWADPECSQQAQWFAWTEQIPLAELGVSMQQMLERGLDRAAVFPTPDAIPGYDRLDESAKREAWRAWYLVEQIAGDIDPQGPDEGAFFPGLDVSTLFLDSSAAIQEEPGSLPRSLPDPHGLDGVWRLEGHGVPRELIPAGPEGATFLTTSEGVLFFPEPGADPAWMVRPAGYLGRVEPTEPGSNGYRDLVLGMVPQFFSEEPSIRVIDGETGEIKFRGFSDDEALLTWTLTTIDESGTRGMIGLDLRGNVVSADLEGNVRYRERLLEYPSEAVAPPGVPVYIALLYLWSGGPFGDANGDGTKDLFASGLYSAGVLAVAVFETYRTPPVVSAYSGRDLELLWHTTLLPPSGPSSVFPIGAGDLDGDGREDLLVYESGFFFLFPTPVVAFHTYMHALSGDQGTPLARGGTQSVCALTCVPDPVAQQVRLPEALADLGGDGKNKMVDTEVFLDYDESPPRVESMAIVTQGLGATPGGPFEETRHELTIPEDSAHWGSQLIVQDTGEGSGQEVLFLVQFFVGKGEDAKLQTEMYRLGAGGVEASSLPEPYGLVQMDPVDGTWYGWAVQGDEWRMLEGEGWTSEGEGMRLVVNSGSVLEHDRNGDGVDDLLLRRSMGYSWASGKSGVLFDDFDRPLTWRLVGTLEEYGRAVLVERELYESNYRVVDLDGEILLEVGEDLLDDRDLRGFVDVTGDGALDLWVQEDGEWDEEYNWIPGDHLFISGDGEEILHEIKGESGVRLFVDDHVVDREGQEILMLEDDEDDLSFELHVVGEQEPRWDLVYEGDVLALTSGVLVLEPLDAAPQAGEDIVLDFFDLATGDHLHEDVVEAAHDQVHMWVDGYTFKVEDVANEGTAQGVYVYQVEDPAGETVEQFLRVVSLQGKKTLSDFRLTDPALVNDDYWNWVESAYMAGFVAGWEGGRSKSIVLYEANHAVVRTLEGAILAVGPMDHGPYHVLDLDQDGKDELGLRHGQRLQFMMYDAAKEGSGFTNDGGERINGTELVARNDTTEVDDENNALPGPAAVFVLAFVGLAVIALRRRV